MNTVALHDSRLVEFIALHNARLIDVQPGPDGHERMTVEHDGTTRELVGGAPYREEHSRREVGKFGQVVPVGRFNKDTPAGACYFHAYIDQSLRRAPELDSDDALHGDDGRRRGVTGWRCGARPDGFRAPVGIIPGEGGRFIPDETVAVTVRVPPEFVREAMQVQMTPEQLLRSFIGDLAGLHNFMGAPRADGYGSNGSDERDKADEWLHRAHGWNQIDLDAKEAAGQEEEEKQWVRDDFAGLLDDYESHGGKADDLIEAVQAIVKQRQEAAEQEGEE